MANLTVISTTAVPDHVRGALSRWMLEPTPGLYVGTLSGKVRDELWAVVAASVGTGAAVVISPSDNEQRFIIRTAGERRRTVEDFDGLMMIVLNPLEADNESAKAV
ncbi:type I-E CRISPR-associated endoribonuclease Cas2e [Streptacidiphilus albus]|uniref:type I-E CRISPR-associated endoribonuclease Cas2e n=1 Tax=Streptacidiphilus albus TaxID=105425 RepID=UPI00054C07F1|nr:type I-E CRISPR-associated endoribonuclease Cas2e [Streptacidiphilus albus]